MYEIQPRSAALGAVDDQSAQREGQYSEECVNLATEVARVEEVDRTAPKGRMEWAKPRAGLRRATDWLPRSIA